MLYQLPQLENMAESPISLLFMTTTDIDWHNEPFVRLCIGTNTGAHRTHHLGVLDIFITVHGNT